MEFTNNEYKDEVGIYLILNKITNKVYIGQTLDRFVERYWNHKWKLKNQIHDNKHLQRAWNKYGENNFEFRAIHILNENENIDDLERIYIDKYKKGSGVYNILNGGQDHTNKGIKMSDETKRKIGVANKINSSGKKASDETKLKMSLARKNKTPWKICHLTEEQAINVKKMILQGVCLKDISSQTGIDYKIINNIYSSNTYKSAYVDGWEEFYRHRNKERKRKIPIGEIEMIKEKYKNGYSLKTLADEYGVTSNGIKNKRKYCTYDNPVPNPLSEERSNDYPKDVKIVIRSRDRAKSSAG